MGIDKVAAKTQNGQGSKVFVDACSGAEYVFVGIC